VLSCETIYEGDWGKVKGDMARFRLFLGRKLIREYQFDSGPITIGRLTGSDILIEHEAVSRKHASVHLKKGQWHVQIEDGKNGLFVNGQFTTSKDLLTADKIEIGNYVIQFIDTPRAISLDEQDPFDIDMDTDSYNTNKVLSEPLERNLDQQTVMVKLSELKRIHQRNQSIMAPHLTWFEESEKKVHALNDLRTLIGKTEDCQIHIRGGLPGVKHFALITKNGGQFYIEPLSRFVPIVVEGETIKSNTPLSDGDRLQIFNQTLHFHEEM